MTHTQKTKALAALLAALMLLILGGWTPAPADATIIEVRSVDELVSAIGPNVTVALLPGDYDLASAVGYGKDTGNPYCRWTASSEAGYELCISGVNGLTLQGAGTDETTILAQDRYANVLSFSGCQDLTIQGLTAGHSPLPGYCSGGVLCLTNCSTVRVEDCGLFGCGTVGVWAINCVDLTVASSRIYECSDSAVSADSCRNVTVQACEIDHNGWKGEYGGASSLFIANGGDGFAVSDCSIHDNTAGLLLQSAHTRGARLVSSRVEYNYLTNAFALFGMAATVDGCSFHENYMDSWYAQGYDEATLTAQDREGKVLTEEALSAMVHRSIGVTEPPAVDLQAPAEVPVGGEITVTSADEFLAAIGPDRTIVLDGDLFSLADLDPSRYGVGEGQYYRWEACYDGPQLVIRYVSNLTIRAGAGKAVTLTATPRYADVLCFETCDHVNVVGLTLGHREGAGECSGAVLHFVGCSDMSVDSCRLYGCGTLGVDASAVWGLQVTDCEIYDCSIGGAVLYSVNGAAFRNCRVHDVPSPMLSIYNSADVSWNGTVLRDNHYDVTLTGGLIPVSLGIKRRAIP